MVSLRRRIIHTQQTKIHRKIKNKSWRSKKFQNKSWRNKKIKKRKKWNFKSKIAKTETRHSQIIRDPGDNDTVRGNIFYIFSHLTSVVPNQCSRGTQVTPCKYGPLTSTLTTDKTLFSCITSDKISKSCKSIRKSWTVGFSGCKVGQH